MSAAWFPSVSRRRRWWRNRFSRQHESEADEAGLKMLLAAHIDPAGMIFFFEAVRKEEGQMPTALSYVSTHPHTECVSLGSKT